MLPDLVQVPPIPWATPSGLRARVGALARSRGTWALADQAVLSLGNFLTNVLLARHLAPAVYGVYALVFGVILFLNSLHSALVTYPLTVRGAACDETSLRHLASRSLGLTCCLAPLMTIGLLCATSHRLSLLPWALGALLLWQVQETLRRTLIARLRYSEALPGDAISYLGQALLVWFLIRRGPLTPEMAFFAVGATSGAAALVQALQLGVAPGGWAQLRPAVAECWRLGRWLLLANLVSAGTIYVSPWTLKAAYGAVEVARFSAISQLLGVTNPVVSSMTGLIVPAVAIARARARAAGAADVFASAKRAALPHAAHGAALLLPYFIFLAIFPRVALRLFYGPASPYLELSGFLRLFVAGYAMGYVCQVCTALLNGLEQGHGTFLSTAVGSVANLVLCVPLAIRFGLAGAVWGGMLPIVLQVATALVLVHRARDHAPERSDESERAGVRPVPQDAPAPPADATYAAGELAALPIA